MYDQRSLPGIDKPTSSPESEGGPTRSDLPDGQTTSPCGPDPALASLSASQAISKGLMTKDTFGPIGGGLLINDALQLSLESRLRARLAAFGSPEYALTWKQWDMESGPPICALRASLPRTSGSDCGGWATPRAEDAESAGMRWGRGVADTLTAQSRLAGWPTPTSRDHKDGEYCPNVPVNALLGRQAWTTGHPAPMEKRGALNPALSRWLMGYPVEWDSCGATAMQLCRGLRRSS